LTFYPTVGAWTIRSASAHLTLTNYDAGQAGPLTLPPPDAPFPVRVEGGKLIVDLTNTLADTSVLAVTIDQILLVDACGGMERVASGGSGGTYFQIRVGRTPPFLTGVRCNIWA
jgi:hypothetical protein